MSQSPSDKLKDILHIEKKSTVDEIKEELVKKAAAQQSEEDVLVAKAWDYYHQIKDAKIKEVLEKCHYTHGAFRLKGHIRSLQEHEIKIFPRTKALFGLINTVLPIPYSTREEIMADFQKELRAQNIQVSAIVAYRFRPFP